MNPQRRTRRGAYAKGLAKREEILSRALDVVARKGYRGASVKEIAESVGLSQAGLLHYFGSKEELFTAILSKRDGDDALRLGPISEEAIDPERLREGYLGVVRRNADEPGLVELFSQLSVEAADPEHPAHAFFADRSRMMRDLMSGTVARAQAEGRMTDRVDPETVARVLQAVADGMQLQWLVDPTVDMAEAVAAVFELLAPPEREEAGRAGPAASRETPPTCRRAPGRAGATDATADR